MIRSRSALPIAVAVMAATYTAAAWQTTAFAAPRDGLGVPEPSASSVPGTDPQPTITPIQRSGAHHLPGAAQPSASAIGGVTSTTPTPTVSPSPCPLPPPQHHDDGDHGYFTVTQVPKPHNQFLVTLTLRCYDADETQNATVTFTGAAPTGAGIPVKVLSGDTTFSFIGHESTAIVDSQQSYLLDPTVLGKAAPEGWHVRTDVAVAPDNSASRAAIIVLGTEPGPTPSVLGFHVRIPHSHLPTTGFSFVPLYAVGLEGILFGIYLYYVGSMRSRRTTAYAPKHR